MKAENNFQLTKERHQLTIREGKALDPKEPVKVAIIGILDSPLRWISKRVNNLEEGQKHETLYVQHNHDNNGEVPFEHCHIIVDRDLMTISLTIGENDHYQSQITGKLEFHPAFKKFGINDGEYITPFEMADLIKMNRTFFENKDVAMALVHTLKNFKAKIDKQVEASEDNRGNKRALIEQAVDSNLPSSFKMVLPIFKGQPKEIIEVEVYIRASDMTCTLISPQANEIQEELRDTAIGSVLNGINEIAPGIVIIEK